MMVMKVRDVIGYLQSLGRRPENTVDGLLSGNETDEVTGIVTTFMPTMAVLQQARIRGMNLVIAHESPFYDHRCQTPVMDDPVYRNKQQVIDHTHMALYRLHDTLHRTNPDWIVQAVIHELAWDLYVTDASVPRTFPFQTFPLEIPEISLGDLALYVKHRLQAPSVRVVGDLNRVCHRIGLLPGYSGTGALIIPFFKQSHLDVIIVGEGPEWEAPEYVRDAVWQGVGLGLIVVGHLASEAAGMKRLANHLQSVFNTTLVKYLEDSTPFAYL
ncbi:MAG: transcriptional regulator [Sulfobacillus thermosulfidooxidans]|nr:MAG: transcriptional regulator [Sulfobacillus thermosulfidooxidans]